MTGSVTTSKIISALKTVGFVQNQQEYFGITCAQSKNSVMALFVAGSSQH
jgi:hypothetical protein